MKKTTLCNWMSFSFIPILLLFFSSTAFGQSGINKVGSFEQGDPSYWHKVENGGTLSWASDEFVTLGKSLKIMKDATSSASMWESENMCDIWSPKHSKDVDIKLGFQYKSEGVNTNPTTDDQRWYVVYEFYDSADTFIGDQKIYIDQSVASSTGWVLDTNGVGETILPRDSWRTIIKFVGGKDATGTVWADEFMFGGRTSWAGGIWNETVGVPEGWIYWLPRKDGLISDGYERTRITDEESYHGKYSLKFDMLDGTHDGFIGTRFYGIDDAEIGDKIRISVWIKGENLQPDSVLTVGDQWSVAITPIFHNSLGGNDGFNDVWASDIPLVFPHATSFDWTQFYVDVTVVENSKSLDVRLHPLGRFQGTVYMDGLTVEKLDVPELSGIGSFEQGDPSYWHKVENGGTLSWASDEFVTLGKSLKIMKDATSSASMWESENMCDIWSPKHSKDVDIKLGFQYKSEGVNTNPTTDDQRWYVVYEFYDSADTFIGDQKIYIDQSVASSTGWVLDTNGVGETILPRDSWRTIIKFVGGKDATGTVWADEFMFGGRTSWAGGIWNETVGVPEGWIYWLPRKDGLISDGYERTRITDEESYHGKYSLKFDMLDGTHDGFIGTRFYPLENSNTLNKDITDISSLTEVKVGDVLRISVWIKGENLQPDSVLTVGDQWSVAITPIFHNSLGGNDGFNDVWASDIPLVFPHATSFDWTQFYVDVTVVENSKSLDVRLHPLGRFQGTVYMDGLTVEKLDVPELSGIGSFEQGDPSYWHKVENGGTLSWASDEFVTLGKSLKIMKDATSSASMWESENMCDIWSPKHSKDVDIKLGFQYKSEGVNTNPTTDDQRWYVVYEFYDSADTFIGDQKIYIDQSVASSTGWVLDTNGVGETILPRDSWRTIIKFVGGKDATGTVWADEFMFGGRTSWAGGIWNETVGVPEGWIYWLPRKDGLISDGYERTRITDEESYHGKYSLKFDMLDGTHDGFVGTRFYPLENSNTLNKVTKDINDISSLAEVKVDDVLRISVWVKGENLQPDSVLTVGDQWSVAITPIFHNSLGGNDGFNDVWASDIPLVFPHATSFDWTQFYVDVTVVENSKSLDVRLHPLGRFQGTVYMDGLTVEKIGGITDVGNELLPSNYSLFQNYPNPFNPSTVISYALPKSSLVSVKIYDMLGREVKSLINQVQNAGINNLTWNGSNNYGAKVASGTYIYMIKAGEFYQAKKMILLK